MGFKRAEWHSGLTYRQTCSECNTTMEYTDYDLDFRPWYADGFVYCAVCKTPLRHHERFAINRVVPPTPVVVDTPANPSQLPAFCTQCGKKFGDEDRFCSGCGNKR